MILGDTTQLHQVLLNLCVNARDAMSKGGTLTLKVDNIEIDAAFTATVADSRSGPHIVWHVEDTGEGIPLDVIDRILEPFFTTKGPDKGTGLGLSTVIGIVKSHQGFMRVFSKPGEGATFSIYLPVCSSEPALTSAPAKLRNGDIFRGNGETILVVDDEAHVRRMTREVLAALNFKVLTASNGTEAILLVTDPRTDIRAIITDLHMPHMDGLALVRVLRQMQTQIKIIVTSGRFDKHDMDELRALEINVFLDKPYSQDQLTESLKHAL